MKALKYILISLLVCLSFSCQNDDKTVEFTKESQNNSPVLKKLIQDTLLIRSDIKREFALKKASTRDKGVFSAILFRIETSLVGLKTQPENSDFFRSQIIELSYAMDQLDIPLRDKRRFEVYTEELRNFVALQNNFSQFGSSSAKINIFPSRFFDNIN